MVTLNITYNGLSVDYPLEIDYHLSDKDVRRIATEVIRSGHVRGLHIANLAERTFDSYVVDRFDTPQGGGKRIYLRPKVPFGALLPCGSTAMKIVFCGVGALGSSAALLCRNLEHELSFVDFDRVESKNLLSQAFVKPSIGKNKAEALKLQLANFYGVKAEAFPVRLIATNCDALLGQAGLLVDCFDNHESRALLSGWARAHDRPLVHAAISADGSFGIVRWEARFSPDAEDSPGQPTCEGGANLPMIGLLSSVLARTIQDFARSGQQRDSVVSLQAVSVSAAS